VGTQEPGVAPVHDPSWDGPADTDAGPGANPAAEHSRDFVQSFARGLAVIRAFSADGVGLTLSDVARSTGLPRAAARRFLLTLETLGYVRCTGRVFTLSPRVLELSHAYLAGSGGDDLLEAINASIPNANASRADLHQRLLPRLMATARTTAAGQDPGATG
jgi:DNA-binding IclR family transcriptional regulator